MFFVKPKKFLGFGRHKPIVEFSIAQIHPRPQAHPPLTVEFCCRVAKHVGQINRSLLHAANSNPRGENAESAPRAASCQVLRLLFLLCSSAAGQGCRWYVAAGGAFSALRRAGCSRLRGGAKFRWRVTAEGAFSAIRRAGCCVVAGPAGRCGRFSCFAHAPLIKKSGQKRNHGLLWPALPSGRSVSGTRASVALRAVSVGDRGRKGSFGCVGKRFGGKLWELGLWSLCCAVGLCL